MKTKWAILLILTLSSFSVFADKCSEEELHEAVYHYENQVSPYQSQGKSYDYFVKEIKEPRVEGEDKVYEVSIGYDEHEQGYRNLEFRAKKSSSQCILQVFLVDEV